MHAFMTGQARYVRILSDEHEEEDRRENDRKERRRDEGKKAKRRKRDWSGQKEDEENRG